MIIAVNFPVRQLEKRSLKKSGLQRDSNPWPPRYWCIALPSELWSHTLGARSIYWVHISREEWNDVKYTWNNSFLIGKFTAMIILHFHLQPLFKNELFWAYYSKHWNSDSIVPNIGILTLCLQTFEFWSYSYKHWNSDSILSKD